VVISRLLVRIVTVLFVPYRWRSFLTLYSLQRVLILVLIQRVIGINRHVRWPVHPTTFVKSSENIDPGTRTPGLSPGCYFDGRAGIRFGSNVRVGPHVKIISKNHDLKDFDRFPEASPVLIGKDCWLGAGSIILPNVQLGPHTIVAAGAVVTKSFREGDVVLGGVPARVVKRLSKYDTRDL
jgi:acetyltransferase-like isoleucine patch superfamily enzyme